jgi:hypothetical protein
MGLVTNKLSSGGILADTSTQNLLLYH